MPGRIARFLDGWHLRKAQERWKKAADAATEMDSFDLRAVRAEARAMRRQIDRVVQAADARLSFPAIGGRLPQQPLGTDWMWRPDAWCGPIPDIGTVASDERTPIGEDRAIYHDCPLGEVAVRQVRNSKEADRAPYGLTIDIFGFRGSFLSLAMNLPEAGGSGLKSRHLVRAEFVLETDRPIRAFARLNIKHGPNLAQLVSELSSDGREKVAEFDLAYGEMNEKRVERAWLDLIFNDVAMTRISLRDVVLSRRPRAEL
jgi:Family of unknown function (DUF6478)